MCFRYLRDPLFVFCLALYAINRWILKSYFPNEFSQGYLNDLICLPFWVPIMLFMMKKLHMRRYDGPPTGAELLIPLILWSWLFEVYLPGVELFKGVATADHLDVLCYADGGLVGAVFWRVWYRERTDR